MEFNFADQIRNFRKELKEGRLAKHDVAARLEYLGNKKCGSTSDLRAKLKLMKELTKYGLED